MSMTTPLARTTAAQRGAEDAGRYFRYMADFCGFTEEHAQAIAATRPIIEKHLAAIVADFYDQLLRYPPTRRFFLRPDGALDRDYIELRMLHQTKFWLRSASGVYDDDYARYVDYVGRAHTSHGADPRVYIAERYVIGMVGFMQHAVDQALDQELHDIDHASVDRATEAWNKLLMIILEMLSRAYGNEREAETFDALVAVEGEVVTELAEEAFREAQGGPQVGATREVFVARADEIAEGERKIIQAGALSIGVFRHGGHWYALENRCLHRGGPVATGNLTGDTLTCPWHGFEYDVRTGRLLIDPNTGLPTYPVTVREGGVYIQVPETAVPVAPGSVLTVSVGADASTGEAGSGVPAEQLAPETAVAVSSSPVSERTIKPNEFLASNVGPGNATVVRVNGERVAVFNVAGTFYATQAACTHAGGPLEQGDLQGRIVTCPWHGSRFDVATGRVAHGPAQAPIKTYRVTIDGEVVRVEAEE
jgi:nitrite reductase/ring-hydroxylating ferredoxin subunit